MNSETLSTLENALAMEHPELEIISKRIRSGERTGQQQFAHPKHRITRDKLFLLSEEEIRKYYCLPSAAVAVEPKSNSLLAFYSGTEDFEGGKYPHSWWLRSSHCAFIISIMGSICNYGYDFTDDTPGVRPALWIGRKGEYQEEALKEIKIKDGTRTTKSGEYSCYFDVTKVSLPDSLVTIEEGTFEHCYSLKEIVLPNSLFEIKRNAFAHCKSLEKIVLPQSLEIIGSHAFSYCSSLKGIVIPSSIKHIGLAAFGNCGDQLFSVKIENGIERIDKHAFCNCFNLQEIEIPSSVVKLCDASFINCTSLKKLILSNGLKEIEGAAFQGCSSLEEVFLPASLEKLSHSAFCGCTSMKKTEVDPSNSFL